MSHWQHGKFARDGLISQHLCNVQALAHLDDLTVLVGELFLYVCGGAYLLKDNCITATMAHTIHYPNDFMFSPFRNLPPVNLAQDIPPEESATILLLECRDPGSILYTIHHNLSNPCRCLCDTIDPSD
jgi:hypothetical protein